MKELQDGLNEGLALGEVTRRMNDGTRPFEGMLARFGLLGDPGMTIAPQPVHSGLETRISEPDPDVIRECAYYLDTVIPRLEQLAWFGLQVDAQGLQNVRKAIVQRSHAHLLGYADYQGRVSIRGLLEDLQVKTLQVMADDIFAGSWNYAGTGFAGLREDSRRPATCPTCARVSTQLHYLHAIDPGLTVTTEQCARCGDVWWTNAPLSDVREYPELTVSGPVDVSSERISDVRIERRFTNLSDHHMSGAWTAVFRSRKLHGLPAPRVHRVSCEARSEGEESLFISLTNPRIRPDVHTMPVISLVDGIYAASMVMLSVPPTDS